jgi:predicted glycogen debranching enzyme
MADFATDHREWLEADGLGGFASGTVSGVRTRRYHAWLLAARKPPTARMVLVNGADVWVETSEGRIALSSQRYLPDVVYPDGASRLVGFTTDPWPTWTWRMPDGVRVRQELVVPKGTAAVVVTWRLVEAPGQTGPCRLVVRPLLSGRDYHATHHANTALRTEAIVDGMHVTWQPYDDGPVVHAVANGAYGHDPDWYRQFLYDEERARGLDAVEDAWSPGWFTWDLRAGDAHLCLMAGEAGAPTSGGTAVATAEHWRSVERARRDAFESPLHRAADAYLVQRGHGLTIIAGYPWFTDWGRDTFIALRGVCLATGRVEDARDILLAWAGSVSEGMLPNRFPDGGDVPEYNAVDASLWFIVAAADTMAAARRSGVDLGDAPVRWRRAAEEILDGYSRGTRFGIRVDADGLVACGEPGVQLTWMDARVGAEVITPRIGKPVEIQALWINALALAADAARFGSNDPGRWAVLRDRATASFLARFIRPDGQGLFDVIDVDHRPGVDDATIRPNQILAAGGLPVAIVNGAAARHVVTVVERELWTPLGLRTLAPGDPAYTGCYRGDAATRDRSYHQGTVWPWLATPFVDAWLRVHDDEPAARADARRRFVEPLRAHLQEAGLGHVSEIADAEPPHTPGGCPFQAWSVGELLRMEQRLRE